MPSKDDNLTVARTRLRGEIDYYDAIWKEWPKARGGYVVKFLAGPHKDEKYEAVKVAKGRYDNSGAINGDKKAIKLRR